MSQSAYRPTVPGGHQEPQACLRDILTLGCQMTGKSVFDLTQRGGRISFYRQVMPTVSGFSPVFSTLKPQESKLKQILPARDTRQLVTYPWHTESLRFPAAGATVNRVAGGALQLQLPKRAQTRSQGAWKEGNHTSGPDQIWFKEKEGAKRGSRSDPLTHPREPQSGTCQDIQHPINLQEKHPCFRQHKARRQIFQHT